MVYDLRAVKHLSNAQKTMNLRLNEMTRKIQDLNNKLSKENYVFKQTQTEIEDHKVKVK